MGEFDHLQRCIEVTRAEVIRATASRDTCKAFLDRFSTISREKDGGPLLLLLFARMATLACDWLDGDLRVELIADGETVICEVLTELGGGAGERVFPPIRINAPLREFDGAIKRVPQMVWPMTLKTRPQRLSLAATQDVRASTMPPAVEIDAHSLVIPKAPSVPRMRISPLPGSPVDGEGAPPVNRRK